MSNEYGFGATLDAPFEVALVQVKAALKAAGFGVLTEIDVRRALQEQLGTEMDPITGQRGVGTRAIDMR